MPTHQDDTLLIFRIDCIPCAVPAASVQSIVMPPPQLTQPPGSNRGRPGIFRHAGHIYSVVDLHQRFGIESPRKGTGRLLLHENGVRRHALWVDEVVGLVRSELGQWAQLPHYLPRSLFHNGFLYQKEIILCSTLDALLAMHDAEPIRRHLESLRQSGATTRAAIEMPAAASIETEAPAPTTATSDKITPTTASREPTVSTPTAISQHTLSKAKAAQPTIAGTTPRPSPPRTPPLTPAKAPPRPGRRPATPARSNTTAITAPRPKAAQPPQTPAAPHARRETSAHSTTGRGGSRWLPWSLLALLLLGGSGLGLYLLSDKPEKEKRKRPPHNPQTAYSRPQAELPQAIPPRAALPESPPAAEPLPAPRPRLTSVTPPAISHEQADNKDTAAIQIEQDEEGTIKLIIQREHLRMAPETPLPAPETDEENTHQSPSEVTGQQAATTAQGEEEALRPDADWPQPASLPEPCDCTHIVVKGDTLWAIAKQYTNNAYNYPELARQSGIRNPHRIYPGNKVRIIVR